jgi:hypothetical protein
MSSGLDIGALEVTRATVRRGGYIVAYLLYSGRMITVVDPYRRTLGRLLPPGFADGCPDDGSRRYDVWTAKHPAVPTPSDRILASCLPLADAVSFLLEDMT